MADFGPENGGHYLLAAGDPRRAVFDALGFAAQEERDEISEERVDLLNRDVLFVNGASKETMLASPTFAGLDVVKADRALYTIFETPLSGALAYSGPKALLYALDVLVPQLAAATRLRRWRTCRTRPEPPPGLCRSLRPGRVRRP